MSESIEAEKPAPLDLIREKAGIELTQAQRTCWREIPWRSSTRMFDSDRATEASKKFALTLFDNRAEAVFRRESDYEGFLSELDSTAANVVSELEEEWRTFSPGSLDEAHVGLTMTCIPAVRRALAENQETWRLRFLDTQLKRMDTEPLEELRALGLTGPISEETARRLWAALLRIDADARRIGPSDPITPVRAAYQAVASHIVGAETPDEVLEEMIPRAIFVFHSQRPWARFGAQEHLNRVLEPCILEWKAAKLQMVPAVRPNAVAVEVQTESDAAAPTAPEKAEQALAEDVDIDEGAPIDITTKRQLHFTEFYGGRQLSVQKGGPQKAPAWVRHTETFKLGVPDGLVVVHEQATNQSDSPSRPEPLPAFVNSGTPEFWRGLRSRFQALITEQRNIGITETHERWLRGSCFYPPGYEDLSRCRIRTGINGQIVSDFQDIATQAAFELGCPPGIDPIAFWLYCLARNLLESDRRELRSEILGDPESGGIVRDLAGSCIGFCSRLASESERLARTRPRPQTEGNQPESTPHPRETEMESPIETSVLENVPDTRTEAMDESAKALQAVPRETGAASWKELGDEFDKYAIEYDHLAGHVDFLRPGRWELIRAASPRVERIFKEIAARAAAKAALSPPDDKTEPWQLWLEFMWSNDWRRPEKPSAHSGPVRQVRPWHVAKRMAEEGARTLPRVFQTSADCCRDREEREEASTGAIQSPVRAGEPASSADGPASRATSNPSRPSTEESGVGPAEPINDSLLPTTNWPDPSPDFASEEGRNRAVAAYTTVWGCSEAALARTATVDPADLSKWKKGALPAGSDKKTRIEKALRNNDPPTPVPERPKD